jgi:hypothetical protein
MCFLSHTPYHGEIIMVNELDQFLVRFYIWSNLTKELTKTKSLESERT